MMYVNVPKDARVGLPDWLHGSHVRVCSVDPKDQSKYIVFVEGVGDVHSVKKKYISLEQPAVVSADLVSSY